MDAVAGEPVPVPDMAQEDPAGEGTGHALLCRLRRGDELAFDQLVRAWWPPMLRVARGFVSTDASAQEVVQDTWLVVIRGLAGFEGRSSLRTWVFRILVNIAKTRGVKEQQTIPLSAVAADEDTGPTVDPSRFRDPGDPEWPRHWTPAGMPRRWDADPEAEVIRGEIRDLVSAAVEALPAIALGWRPGRRRAGPYRWRCPGRAARRLARWRRRSGRWAWARSAPAASTA